MSMRNVRTREYGHRVAIPAVPGPVDRQCSGIWVGTTGNVVVTMAGTEVTFTAVPAGYLLPVCVEAITSVPANSLILWY